jgi:DeoR family fructose operon transcriptional repressor
LRGRPLIRANELASHFGVSIETIRRDLIAVERDGLVRRVYGGVTRPPRDRFEASFDERRLANIDRKRAMARVAAALVTAGDTLILDVGTSVAEIALALSPAHRGLVFTNSLLVATTLAGRPGIELQTSGGKVRAGDLACYGPTAEGFFANLYGGTAFLGSGGVHPSVGLTDYHPDEVPMRRVILDHARVSYVMADSSKLGRLAPVKVCDLDRVTGIITDDGVDDAVARDFEQAGVRLIVAPAGSGTGADFAVTAP